MPTLTKSQQKAYKRVCNLMGETLSYRETAKVYGSPVTHMDIWRIFNEEKFPKDERKLIALGVKKKDGRRYRLIAQVPRRLYAEVRFDCRQEKITVADYLRDLIIKDQERRHGGKEETAED